LHDPITGVTVIVPTLNRGGFLVDCLRDLVAQTYRPLEILVIDQSSEADTSVDAIVREHHNMIEHRRVNFRGLPRARNFGWNHARYDMLIYVDDDTRFGPDFVSSHVDAMKEPGVGLVAGAVDTISGRVDASATPGVYRRWTATPLRGFAAEIRREADHAAGCNFSVRRSAMEKAGGFDERLSTGPALYEETDLCLRVKSAGYRIVFDGRARLTHLVAPGGGCRVDKVRDYVKALSHNRAMMIRRHGRWFHAPVALGRLAGLGLSYARHYRRPAAVVDCVVGGILGLIEGGRDPFRQADAGTSL